MDVALCDICKVSHSKYRCPRCGMKSCSLDCVKKHKLDHNCSGVRCKTEFVSLANFSDARLLNDYYFLEEVGRFADSAQRDRTYFNNENSDSQKRSQTFHWLCNQAYKRGIQLKLHPQGMAKHNANTSKSIKNKNTKQWVIHWRVHLWFAECQTLYQVDRVSEDIVLRELLDHYIHPTSSHPIIRHKLNRYVLLGVNGIEVWLKGEGGVAHQLLDISSTLKENLNHKTITEFPILVVMPKGVEHPWTKIGSPPNSPSQADSSHKESLERDGASKEMSVAPTLSLQMISDMYSDSEGEEI